jgi:hypothetical protein
MIRIRNHKQMQISDPWLSISPIRKKRLEQGWPGLFRTHILPELPVREFSAFFDKDSGRPTKEISTVLGILILQETLDLTDERTVDEFAFNIQWHYALDVVEESDSAKYMCLKTLWNMRKIVAENGFEKTLLNTCTDKLASVFKVDTDKQRIDSVHIKSNMRRLGRIGIFTTGIRKFLVNLKRHHKPLFDSIDTALIERYLSKKQAECFSKVKPSESHKTLEIVADDLFDLLEQFKALDRVTSMSSYKLLGRILNDHCNISPEEDGDRVTVKPPGEIASDSLQNPSDPDASYSGHKGQGYQVQIMETYTDVADKKSKAATLNLITHVEVERAHESDANALIPAVKSTRERNLMPKEILADALYGSDDNVETAAVEGVEVVAPVMGTVAKDDFSLSDFAIGKAGKIVSCPAGRLPVKTKKKKDRHCATFSLDDCRCCEHREICPVKPGKKAASLRYTDKEWRIALRRACEKTDVFKDRYRWRAGVEATMSQYDRVTGVKKLRVRGFKAVRYAATLKALGINLLRAVAVMVAINNHGKADQHKKSTSNTGILTFKERLTNQILIMVAFYLRLIKIWQPLPGTNSKWAWNPS